MSGLPAPKTDTGDHQGDAVDRNAAYYDRDGYRGVNTPKDHHTDGNVAKLFKPGTTGNLRTVASSLRHDVPISSKTRKDGNNIFTGDNDRKNALSSLPNTDLEDNTSLHAAKLPGADTSHSAKYDLPRRSHAKALTGLSADASGRRERGGSSMIKLEKPAAGLNIGVGVNLRSIPLSPRQDTSEMPMPSSKHRGAKDSGLLSTSLSVAKKVSGLRSSQMESKNAPPEKAGASRTLMKALPKSSSRNGGVNLRSIPLSPRQDTSEMPMPSSKHRGAKDSGLLSTSLSVRRKVSGLRSSQIQRRNSLSSAADRNSRGVFEVGVDTSGSSGKARLDARDKLSRVHHIGSTDGELSQQAIKSEPSTKRNVAKQRDSSGKLSDSTLSINHSNLHSLRRSQTGNTTNVGPTLHKSNAPTGTLTQSKNIRSKLDTEISQHQGPVRPVTLRAQTGADHSLSRTDVFTQHGSEPNVVLQDCGQMNAKPAASRSRGTDDFNTEEQAPTGRLGPLNPQRRPLPEELQRAARHVTRSKAVDCLHPTKEVAVVPLNVVDLSVLQTPNKSGETQPVANLRPNLHPSFAR